jgi:Icc protein
LRILQVTDPHILSDFGKEIYGSDTFESLRSVLQAAITLNEPPDIMVVTGDLSEDGSETSYQRLRELLLETNLPTYVIPGNHDSISQMKKTLIGDRIQMKSIVDFDFWRLVLLNSKVPNASHGFLEQQEIQLLESALEDNSERSVVTCLHHGPISPCPSKGCQLNNTEFFLATLKRYPKARVVLAGHAHIELEKKIDHVTLLTTPATSSLCIHAQEGAAVNHEDFWDSHEFDSTRRGFRILDIQDDGNFKTKVHWVH